MVPSFLSNLMKRKRIEDEDEVILSVDVRYADGIDKNNMGPKGDMRTYQVFGWVRPDNEFSTPEVYGEPDPAWKLVCTMPLGKNATGKYLHLEVVRTGSKSDPGTSSGDVLVGRTRIPLPEEVHAKQGGRYGLVRPMGAGFVAEGHITVTMEMISANYFNRY